FDGDDSAQRDDGSTRPPTHSGEPQDGSGSTGAAQGSGGGEAGDTAGKQPAPRLIVPLSQVAKAHQVMAGYMAGLSTYDHTSSMSRWAPPLLKLTTGDAAITNDTAL